MYKICFVVHRYAPYQGGSELFIQALAEECVKQGHSVTVYTNQHKGNLNGVNVTSDHNILLEQFNIIVVHGGNCISQDTVHMNSHIIKSPILYMLILPSTSVSCMTGLKNCEYIGCSTEADWEHVRKFDMLFKAHYIRHSVPNNKLTIGIPNIFRNKYNIPYNKKMLLSCGGYWQHKGMIELANIVNIIDRQDIILVLTGYNDDQLSRPQDSDKVKTFLIEDKEDIAHAMADMDLYIMNSTEEGYGLVLIETMLNKKPWISRNIAGAIKMKDYGLLYETQEELQNYLINLDNTINSIDIEKGYTYAMNNHLTQHTVADILKLIT